MQRVEANQTIFAEGEGADALFNVTAGTVKLYELLPDGRRQITGFLVTGDFLGLAMNENYAYSAETVTPTSLCQFPRRKMEALLDEFPKMQRRLFSMASNELAAAQDQMLLLGRKTAREKICSFLLMLAQRQSRRGHKDNPVYVPMSRADIADYLGLTTETVRPYLHPAQDIRRDFAPGRQSNPDRRHGRHLRHGRRRLGGRRPSRPLFPYGSVLSPQPATRNAPQLSAHQPD